ncbi:MAG: agmatinase [Planctomycetota bacterium]|jgi:agmatinase
MEPFGGEPCTASDPFAVLVPVPYEKTTTYRKGTAQGPAALLAASTQVELFDEEMRCDPLERGVLTLDAVECESMPDVLAGELEDVCLPHFQAGRLVGVIGGEHSVSLGAIRAAARRHEPLGILQIDAHPDLRESYEGTRFGHGCVMKRALDIDSVSTLVGVGLRAVSDEDDAVIRHDDRVHPFYAYELSGRGWIGDVLDKLPEKVYVTFDVDGLDPSVVPGTGTPEPGGLSWWDALALVRRVFAERTVVGFDVVELLPEPPSCVSDFAAARLVMKMLAYHEAAR